MDCGLIGSTTGTELPASLRVIAPIGNVRLSVGRGYALEQTAYDALRAAQDQAWWASSAAIAAWMTGLLSLCVTSGGLWFVWRQLKATESSAIAARQAVEIAYRSERAWLQMALEDGDVRRSGNRWIARFPLTVRNIGRSPALAAHILHSEDGSVQTPPPGVLGGQTVWTIWPKGERHREQTLILQSRLSDSFWLPCLVVNYRLPGESIWRSTPMWLELRRGECVDPLQGDVFALTVREWDHQLNAPT